eukprot:c33584_g1_i1 orf=2-217(+)
MSRKHYYRNTEDQYCIAIGIFAPAFERQNSWGKISISEPSIKMQALLIKLGTWFQGFFFFYVKYSGLRKGA